MNGWTLYRHCLPAALLCLLAAAPGAAQPASATSPTLAAAITTSPAAVATSPTAAGRRAGKAMPRSILSVATAARTGKEIRQVIADGAPARQAQRVSVDFQSADLDEVLKVLKEKSGYQFDRVGGRQPLETFLGARVTLKADDQPVKDVLRQACDQTGHKFRRINSDRFWIEPGEMPPRPHAERVGPCKVFIESMRVSAGARSVSFSEGLPTESAEEPGLTIELILEADTDDDATRVYQYGDLSVVDSEGKDLAPLDDASQERALQFMHFMPPDRARKMFRFEPPADGATRLSTVIGKVWFYGDKDRREVRLPVDQPAVAQDIEGATIELASCERMGGEAGGGPAEASRQIAWEARVKTLRLGSPHETPQFEGWKIVKIRLEDTTGTWRESNGMSTSMSHRMEGGKPVPSGELRMRFQLPAGAEPKALVAQIVRGGRPSEEETFILRDIPLPR